MIAKIKLPKSATSHKNAPIIRIGLLDPFLLIYENHKNLDKKKTNPKLAAAIL